MSKLHFYRLATKEADGDGEINTAGFTAAITSGSVKKGYTYVVKQGQSPTGDSYPCTTGASRGGTAVFGARS